MSNPISIIDGGKEYRFGHLTAQDIRELHADFAAMWSPPLDTPAKLAVGRVACALFHEHHPHLNLWMALGLFSSGVAVKLEPFNAIKKEVARQRAAMLTEGSA